MADMARRPAFAMASHQWLARVAREKAVRKKRTVQTRWMMAWRTRMKRLGVEAMVILVLEGKA